MKINPTVHARAGQSPALRAALEQGHTNNAARNQDADAPAAAPASPGTRALLGQRLGLTDPNASNEQILAALDNTLAAVKAKRVHTDAADELYNRAWGDSAAQAGPPLTATAVDAAMYELAFGEPIGA